MTPKIIVERVLEYAKRTHILNFRTPRLSAWQPYELPDMRGFTPHLRCVNRYKDQQYFPTNEDLDAFPSWALWIIHDICHILFYDFATLNLGWESWNEADRFLENHLASEAFAVLALDYYSLIHTNHQGLTIDLSAQHWNSLQEIAPTLPDLGTHKLNEFVVNLYLTGSCPIQTPQDNSILSRWLGHEQRYSAKQRSYVVNWLNDLRQEMATPQMAVIEGSYVSEGINDLLDILTGAHDRWTEYVSEVADAVCDVKNVFSQYPKYLSKPTIYDFRYTDILGFPMEKVFHFLEEATQHSPSNLFLFWQLLTMSSPSEFTADKLRAIQDLARASQTVEPILKTWETVRQICLSNFEKTSWTVYPDRRSTFFLP